MLTRPRLIVGGGLALAACAAIIYIAGQLRVTEDGAVASLSEPALSKRYTSAFWDAQQAENTLLWNRAVSACREAPSSTPVTPNCAIVVLVAGGSAQEKLARELLDERRRVETWVKNGASAEIGEGLTGRGAKAGGLPTLTHEGP